MAEGRSTEAREERRNTERRRTRAQQKNNSIDIPLLIVMAGLMIFGLLMIFSTSAYNAGEDQASFLRTQLLAEVLGTVAIFLVVIMPYSFLKFLGNNKVRWIILGFAIFMLLLLKTPLGITAKGATRWIRLGPLRVQPAEIAKVAVIIFFASYISEKPEWINTLKGYFHMMGVAGVLGVLVYGVSKNLSSAIIVMGIATLMMFLATKDWKFQMIGYPALVFLAGSALIKYVQNHPDPESLSFRYQRILIWLDPAKYVTGNGYQTLQALYAIGSGGITGKGIGKGIQKLGTIPEVHNDMIFSVICEELGLVGAVVVLILFAILLYRCLLIAFSAKDSYGMLLCMGVFLHIALQVVLNILVVTNTMPNTGVSLPFISYGGSSVSFLMAEMGLVLRVARENEV
ncbi:MAG: FtsW/RodA/SpoVE family cell cycle protein [Lachnospiraceae bacterium]|nr:FtsW/RodA/SpoVE family cell cycle protein [Lachnospiraceae bacterium]